MYMYTCMYYTVHVYVEKFYTLYVVFAVNSTYVHVGITFSSLLSREKSTPSTWRSKVVTLVTCTRRVQGSVSVTLGTVTF